MRRHRAPSETVVREALATLAVRKGRSADELRSALERYLDYALTPEERTAIDEIEAERERLSELEELIPRASDKSAGLAPVGEICKRTSKSSMAATLLFLLVREHRPAACLELGTSLGISAAYQAKALELNGGGRLVTIELQPERARIARGVFDRLGLDVDVREGRFREVLPELLEEYRWFDYAFIDGHHQRDPTIAYYKRIRRHMRTPGLMVFDDINWSEGMADAWSEICADSMVADAVSLHNIGLALV